jgi:uroporphyrin-III C-methyltransferase/precorrin-2 dehydrogenase/sirohydrochlorin ferrochelatase
MPQSDLNETQTGRLAPRTARMQPLATLPIFFKLAGKRAIVAGGSEPALWKTELLAAAGAHVEVYANDFSEDFVALAHSSTNGSVTLKQTSWQSADLRGAAIAISAATDDNDAAAFATTARQAGVPVNVIDRPAFCDFQFGAIVNRSPLVVAISTDGGAPVFGQAIRSLIESLLPSGFRRWAEVAKTWRSQGDRLCATVADKRRFWERFAAMAMRNSDRAPTEKDLDQLVHEATEASERAAQPVTIIDVGESTETLTLGAVGALRRGDIIFFSQNIPDAVLDFARREARRRRVSAPERDIATVIDEIITAASSGQRVILLNEANSSHGGPAAAIATERLRSALRKAGLPTIILACAAAPQR